jgi:hypothetical protein
MTFSVRLKLLEPKPGRAVTWNRQGPGRGDPLLNLDDARLFGTSS